MKRLRSLDALRGAAVVAMIFVGASGNDASFPWLRHAAWHGWTPTDLIFPCFLFISGASLCLSISRHRREGMKPSGLLRRALVRNALLFALGLLGNGLPDFYLPNMRVMGVLQRIALCDLAAVSILLVSGLRAQAWGAAGLLAGPWALLALVPVPGFGPGVLTPEGNLFSYLDRLLIPGRLYSVTHDPEGLLSTLPALATTLGGALAGHWLLSPGGWRAKARGLAAAGILAAALGRVWGLVLPINKNLWTGSFALWSGGWAACLFALLLYLEEARGLTRWARPLEAYGRNPLLVYCLSMLVIELQGLALIDVGGRQGDLREWLCARLFGWAGPRAASLLYAAAYTLLWLPLVGYLYRRKVAARL